MHEFGDDEPLEKQWQDVLETLPVDPEEDLPGYDEVPGGRGDFGLAADNPIPVNGPVGEAVYLNRLRTRQGARLVYHRLGSLKSPASPHPVHRYECIALDGSRRLMLHFVLYHARRSRRAPDGFVLGHGQTCRKRSGRS